MSEPQQKPGRSKQDYSTPPAFLEAIARQFGAIDLDLACRTDNMVAAYGLAHDKGLDALTQDWETPIACDANGESGGAVYNLHMALVRVAFANPPFADIRPWAAKVESCRWLPRWTLMLVPASMGSKWWVDHVLNKTMAFGIPRMQFVGADSLYPKDLALIAAGFGVSGTGYWDWRKLVTASKASAPE